MKFVILTGLFTLFINCVILNKMHAQNMTKAGKIEIPFDYYNGLIMIDVKINGLKLQFIYDTGAEHTILSRNEILDLININLVKEVDVFGADLQNTMKAYITEPVLLEIFNINYVRQRIDLSSEEVEAPKYELKENIVSFRRTLPILVLDRDIFASDSFSTNIDGILGASFFNHMIVEIDYQKEKLILYFDKNKVNFRGFDKVDSYFSGSKPHLNTKVKIIKEDTLVDAKLLIDTGCSIPILLLDKLDHSFSPPEKVVNGQIGIGLGGEMKGWIGLTNNIEFNNFKFDEVITKFQSIDTSSIFYDTNIRDGLVGNEIMKRFTIIIDYFRKEVYLKPNKKYGKSIKYDKSGLTLFASGNKLNEYFIRHIIEGSPSDKAGLKVNDKIIKFQGWSYKFWTLESMINKLKKKEGKKIKITVLREDKKMKFEFRLKDMYK